MNKYLKLAYVGITVRIENIAGENAVAVDVEDYGNYTFEVKANEIDELIKALQEAKEVLSRGEDN